MDLIFDEFSRTFFLIYVGAPMEDFRHIVWTAPSLFHVWMLKYFAQATPAYVCNDVIYILVTTFLVLVDKRLHQFSTRYNISLVRIAFLMELVM